VKRELIGFLIIISCIFLISRGIVYPKEDVEIVIQTGHNRDVNSVAISPYGNTVVSGSDDYTVRLWDKDTGKEIRRLQGHTDGVNSVLISTDGKPSCPGVMIKPSVYGIKKPARKYGV
jgi:WD40 repeat protein